MARNFTWTLKFLFPGGLGATISVAAASEVCGNRVHSPVPRPGGQWRIPAPDSADSPAAARAAAIFQHIHGMLIQSFVRGTSVLANSLALRVFLRQLATWEGFWLPVCIDRAREVVPFPVRDFKFWPPLPPGFQNLNPGPTREPHEISDAYCRSPCDDERIPPHGRSQGSAWFWSPAIPMSCFLYI